MIYAIGDIHGKGSLLKQLHAKIIEDIEAVGDEQNTIVFLGDYIDRGSQNVMVIDFIRNLRDTDNIQYKYIIGNHESIFKEAMENPTNPFFVRMWTQNGGNSFLTEVKMDFQHFHYAWPWHIWLQWLSLNGRDYYETEDYVFVHGGLDRRVERMNRQEPEVLRWARFQDADWYKDYPKMVIHGHTPGSYPVVDNNRINVDTSWAYAERPVSNLTAVALPNRKTEGVEPRFIEAETPYFVEIKKSEFA